jgi:hypothetical protein
VRITWSGSLVAILFATNAWALCGDVSGDGQRTATDALMVLNVAVGQPIALNCSCAECGTSEDGPAARAHCADANGDGQPSATDALLTLNVAVGQPVPLACSCEACASSTTTTTIGDCPPADGLDDRTFNEIYTCSIAFGSEEPSCADLNVGDAIRFNHTGGGIYEVRDEPDTGFVYNGALDCTTFTWDAVDPGEYTESGVWQFSGNLVSFSGSSTYEAVDDSYTGECNATGREAPATPPNPTPVPACQ